MVRKYSTDEIKNLIRLEATKQGVPVEVALAVAQQESGFNNLATNTNDDGSIDRGVMQLNSKYHKLKNWQDPMENIAYGIRHLKGLLAGAKGDVRKALSNYNAGANATGKKRKQGDAYAQKVMALMNKKNNNMTGAAAPVSDVSSDNSLGDRMSNLVQGNVDLATQGISNYASTPYNPSMALALRVQRQREYEDMLNKLVRETPINPTPEQVLAASQPFNQNVQNMAVSSTDAMNRIQGLTGAERYQPYEEKLRQAYENQISRLEAANPYTQLGQMAPTDLSGYNRAMQISNAQQDLARGLASTGGVPYIPPADFAARRIQEAQAAQAEEMARQTGLTPEQFLQGQTANYNQMATQLAAQNRNLNDLYARAMQGDIQAIQAIQQIATNLNANMTSNAANQATAQHQLRQDQLAVAKENRERYFNMLNQIQGLDIPMVQEGGAQQRANTTTAGSMFNTGLTSGTNAAGNLADYEGRMISGQESNIVKPPTPQQVINTYGQVAGMSNDPTAIQNWANAAGQAYSAAGVPDAYLLPFLNNQSKK